MSHDRRQKPGGSIPGMDQTTTPSTGESQLTYHDSYGKTSSDIPPDMDHNMTLSPDMRQSTAHERRRKARHSSQETEITRKSKKTTDILYEHGVPSTDYTSGAGTSITCEPL